MNILAIDTTGDYLCLALQAGGRLYRVCRRPRAAHDQTLIPAVEKLLLRAKLKLGDLQAMAAASGPGRFTGIRIGMAYAGVAASQLKIPAVAVSRLEAIAFKMREGRLVCALVSGIREEKFYQLFRRAGGVAQAVGGPAWVDSRSWARMKDVLERRKTLIGEFAASAEDLIAPAAYYLGKNGLPKFEPLYLKPAGYENKILRPG